LDVEFMHRLLRDYFALQKLQPLLADPDLERRIEAILNLGFQGESAIDPLAEFARHPEPRIRAAAVTALGRIAASEVDPFLDAACDDREPIVRHSAILATRNRGEGWFARLARLAQTETDSNVALTLLDAVVDSGSKAEGRPRVAKQVLTNHTGNRALL